MRKLVAAGLATCAAIACGGESASAPGGQPASGGESPPPAPPASTDDAGTQPDAASGQVGDCAGKVGPTGARTLTIASGGRDRTFGLHVPPTYAAGKAMSLVFVFHGYTQTGAQIATTTKFAEASDARSFMVVFPEGTSGGFNAGECCGPAATSNVDDVGFTRDMLKRIGQEYCVDAKRVFATGFSNGGFVAYRLACEMSDAFAAVASVAGTLGLPPDSCLPKRPVPLLHVHGTGDVIVPYVGGGIGNNRSVDVSVGAFRTKNACAAGAGTPVYTKNDVTCTQWGGCKDGADVKLCAVQNGGHQWPGGGTLPYGGFPSPNLDTTNAIMDFFDAHPMK